MLGGARQEGEKGAFARHSMLLHRKEGRRGDQGSSAAGRGKKEAASRKLRAPYYCSGEREGKGKRIPKAGPAIGKGKRKVCHFFLWGGGGKNPRLGGCGLGGGGGGGGGEGGFFFPGLSVLGKKEKIEAISLNNH